MDLYFLFIYLFLFNIYLPRQAIKNRLLVTNAAWTKSKGSLKGGEDVGRWK